MSDSNLYELDLDELNRPAIVVKLNNKPVNVYSPDVEQLIKLQSAYEKFKKNRDNTDGLSGIISEFQSIIKEIAPDIGETKLNLKQILALFTTVMRQSQPLEFEEMSKQNITPASTDTKKNENLNTSESSLNSSTTIQDTHSEVS
jgi:hypothetical protein